jgi:hypothetical protein
MRPAAALLLLLSSASACSDPVVGEWEGQTVGCGTANDVVHFVIDDELLGNGDFCVCEYDFEVEDRGDDSYRFDVDFGDSCVGLSGFADGQYDCDLERDGERLDCGVLGDFRKIGD